MAKKSSAPVAAPVKARKPKAEESALSPMRLPNLKNGPIERWQLDDLIKTASKMNLLRAATSSLTQFVQQHRNLIHPGKFLREKRILDAGDAHIVWGVFMKICNELSSRSTVGAA